MCISCLSMMAQGMAFEPEGTTLEQASVKAKAEKKLIFLDCFTSWCGPCKKMAKDVFPQKLVGDYMNPKFICLKIDMESAYGAPLAKKLQIQAYPTFVIFNADAQEIGRFLGGSSAEEFIKKVGEKSVDNAGSELEKRWQNGDRDPQFLKEYLKTLTASYKGGEANQVAEAILQGKESTFASDPELRDIFLRSITNPFAPSFVYTAKNPETLASAVGEGLVKAKISNVFNNFQRELINEDNGTATLDQDKFDKFAALLKDLNVPNANHYTLTTLITVAEKQKDYASYIKNIKAYLADPNLDADDMQIAKWARPFTDPSSSEYKEEIKAIMKQRLADIESGKRKALTQMGNMRLSVPTDQLLRRVLDAMDGKMPQ